MKHLKKFEELNKSTYLSAADKLQDKGHVNRADKLRNFASDIIVSDDNFTFYINRSHSTGFRTLFLNKNLNPKLLVGKITDIHINKVPNVQTSEPKRSLIDKFKGRNIDNIEVIDSYNLELEVVFSNGITFNKNVGVEHLQETFTPEETISDIIFETRADALKFVRICNDYIKNNTKTHSQYAPVDIKYLKVNDFYKD